MFKVNNKDTSVPFLYPLKTSENLWHFQGVGMEIEYRAKMGWEMLRNVIFQDILIFSGQLFWIITVTHRTFFCSTYSGSEWFRNFLQSDLKLSVKIFNWIKMSLFFRSSHRRCSLRKGVLTNFAKFTRKHLCQSFFFNKVAGLRPATLLKKRLWHRYFPVNFAKFLRTPFPQNTFSTEHLQASAFIFYSKEFHQWRIHFISFISSFPDQPLFWFRWIYFKW